METVRVNNAKLVLKIGDITEEDTEAIVNAANSSLMGGGGVDGAIHSKGGPEILKECKEIRKNMYPNGLPTGEAVITTGGNLKAKYVIHTVGPICYEKKLTEEKKELLKKAYTNSLRIAKEKNIKTVAFPSISTGAYGCPVYKSAKAALKAVIDFLNKENHIKEVRFVLFTEDTYKEYKKALQELLNEL